MTNQDLEIIFSKAHEEKNHALNIINDAETGIANHPSIPVLIRKARDYASNYYYNAHSRDSHTSSYGAPEAPASSYTAAAYSAPTAPRESTEEDDNDDEILLAGVSIQFELF